jgi:hypothetical protein
MPTISSPQAEQRCTTTAFKALTTRPPKSSTCSGFNILSINPLHLQRMTHSSLLFIRPSRDYFDF